jgi:hypothetical protein
MIDRKTVMDKYDEVSRLESLSERRKFLLEQSEEMKVALWLENIDRKIKGRKLTSEQEEILDVIRTKFITVKFAESARGKSEEEAGPEYTEIMSKASQLLGEDNLKDLFVILGDSSTLKLS